jgi:uncharacterized protein YutE (UPF0331/DUF86 family)
MEKKTKLLALEKNILKFRAIQMVLMLHEVENLKTSIVNAIRATDRILNSQLTRLPMGERNVIKNAISILIKVEVLTLEEGKDLEELIQFRNMIGHSIHSLLSDVSAPNFALDLKHTYDYSALERIINFRKKIQVGMMGKFVQEIDFRDIIFEQAGAAYKNELRRLEAKITKQLAVRRKLQVFELKN